MTDAELMADLFKGSDMAHGRTEMTGQISGKGKHEAKSWTEKRAAETKDWEAHLGGSKGLGIVPLSSKNEVHWGAIDVDTYNLSIEQLNDLVQKHQLPLVICRSKSGGPHIYLFTKDWVPAKLMIEKLDALAGFLGFGTSEIFPKQAMIHADDKNPDFGSWINMPYFNGLRNLRYALDEKNQAIKSIPLFVAYCQSRAVGPQELRDFEPPVPKDILPDGPPCLNQIIASRPTEMRNIILANVAVYARKAKPEGWESELDRINALFPTPLPSNEVETLKKSYAKKDYRYQCSKQPLCSFCNSSACKKQKHGIGGQELMPASRSLTKIDTVPPVWFLDVELPGGTEKRMSLTTEQLQNPVLFQRRCMEVLHACPPVMKREEWQPVVSELLRRVSVVAVPPEMTPEGQFVELFQEFLTNRAKEESFEDMLRGLPHKNVQGFHFRMKDLDTYLKNQRFNAIKDNELRTIIKTTFKGEKRFKVIAGKGTSYIHVPPWAEQEETQPLQTPDSVNPAF
jgi:hypothetical protein